MYLQRRMESVALSLDILRNIKCKIYDKEIVVQKLRKYQKKLSEKINVLVPNVMGI